MFPNSSVLNAKLCPNIEAHILIIHRPYIVYDLMDKSLVPGA